MKSHRKPTHSHPCLYIPALVLAMSLAALSSCAGGQPKPSDRAVTAEDIRKANERALVGGPQEDQICSDLLGKVVLASGPEEGAGRIIKEAWTVEKDEIKRFIVADVQKSPDGSQWTITADILFDASPKLAQTLEGKINIVYTQKSGAWSFQKVRRADPAQPLKRTP